jgi:hypothetical protein
LLFVYYLVFVYFAHLLVHHLFSFI